MLLIRPQMTDLNSNIPGLQTASFAVRMAPTMNRKSFLQLFCCLLMGATLVSCAGTNSQSAANWPGKKFTTVRAFVYDCDADKTVGFFQKDGKVSKGVINGTGAALNAGQVTQLMKTLTTPTPRQAHTACFIPHHAFVFYGADGGVVGHVEVCFTCDIHRSFPAGLPKHVNMTELWNLLGELDVARGEGRKFYQDLYKRTCNLR